MIKWKKIISLLLLLCFSIITNAQDKSNGSLMRSSGRIYVVVAVMLTILIGLVLYIVRLDRRISKLEKQ